MLDINITENNKEFKSHRLRQKRRKSAYFDAKRIPLINKCLYKLGRIICIQVIDMTCLWLGAKEYCDFF